MDTVNSRRKLGTESVCNSPEAGGRLGSGGGRLGDKVREGIGADCGGPCNHRRGFDSKPV